MSKRGKIICVSGWANSGEAFDGLEQELMSSVSIVKTDVSELLQLGREQAEASESRNLSPYALGLGKFINDNGGPAAVLGWSMGGMVALELAIAEPRLINKLLLVSSTACFVSKDDFQFGTPPNMLEHFQVGLRIAFEETLAMFYRLAFDPEGRGVDIDSLIARAYEIGVHNLVDGLDYLATKDFRAGLNSLIMPLHFLHGREDKIISFQAAEYAQLHAPGSTLTLVEGCGHGIVKTIPKRVADWVLGCSRH